MGRSLVTSDETSNKSIIPCRRQNNLASKNPLNFPAVGRIEFPILLTKQCSIR